MYQRNQAALKKRLRHFEKIPKLDWENLDRSIVYYYRKDRKEKANQLGYRYISEATVKLYFKYMSYPKTAKALGMSEGAIVYELKRIGIKIQKPGGYRPGDRRTSWTRDRFQPENA